MTISKKALRRQIESTFADVPYPGDDDICRGFDDEFKRVAKVFKGRH